MIVLAHYNAFLMRGRYNSADAVQAVRNQVPLILCKPHKQMDKGRNGARYFRNPPQPHMCIQDFIEETNEPCFINVLSWVKISTPRKPEDPIPLYGGMRVPHNSSAALSLSSHFGAKGQPVIFAVMANPEILRLSGKTAEDPSDRDALVELMIDFVEAMNPDVRFKREFTVLRDRDLAGELKDIWLAVQAKRERERGENGRRDGDKLREGKDVWREEVRQKAIRDIDREDRNVSSLVHLQNHEKIDRVLQDRNREERSDPIDKGESRTCGFGKSLCETVGEMSSVYLSSVPHLTTPSTETLNSIQQIGSIKYEEEAVYSLIRSHYAQENNRLEDNTISSMIYTKQSVERKLPKLYSSSGTPVASKEVTGNIFSCCNSSVEKESVLSHGASVPQSGTETLHPLVESKTSCPQHTCLQEYNTKIKKTGEMKVPSSNDAVVGNAAGNCKSQNEDRVTQPTMYKSIVKNTSSTPSSNDPSIVEEQISSDDHKDEKLFVNSKGQVPNLNTRSHEDLPGVSDTTCMKFTVGADHSTVTIP